MKIILPIAVFLLIVMANTVLGQGMPPVEAGVSHDLAKWRAAHYSDVRYKLNLTLEKGAPLMKGEIEIRVNLTEAGAKNDLVLDWRTTAFANDKDKPFARVTNINGFIFSEKDEGYAYSFRNEHLIIGRQLWKTGENTVKIEFASPIKTSGAAITRYVDKEDNAEYIYSLFVPSDASTAFPCFDQPDLKARFKLETTIPSTWKVISNSPIESSPFSARLNLEYVKTTIVFKETQPISTYVFAFAAGNFKEFAESTFSQTLTTFSELRQRTEIHSVSPESSRLEIRKIDEGVSIYVRKSQAEKFKPHAAEVFRLNREAVKYLAGYFDYKFPFPKYDLVLLPEFPFRGMEHAGATFLREDSIIFPSEPTANDYISRGNVIFHEAAHQWFGDTVTMRWFDDLWLKEGFAEFMAYKTMEKVLPQYNAWKAFYERNKPLAYLTDSTRGTTPIYQEIPNLSAAKSAYGNIVYRKAPAFLRQAEFYLGEDKLQTAVRSFLKQNAFKNAEWQDLVEKFENVAWDNLYMGGHQIPKEREEIGRQEVRDWARSWVTQRGMPLIKNSPSIHLLWQPIPAGGRTLEQDYFEGRNRQRDILNENKKWTQHVKFLGIYKDGKRVETEMRFDKDEGTIGGGRQWGTLNDQELREEETLCVFPNYQDYGYGIFLLDEQSRDYILANIQNEKDDFLRSMMWGALWDSVRETELAPQMYVELAVKNISAETDELTIQTILSRVTTAMNYYLSEKQRETFAFRVEAVLIERMQNAPTMGQRITFFRAFLNVAATENARRVLKEILSEDFGEHGGNTKTRAGVLRDSQTGKLVYAANPAIALKTKDKFDIVTRLLILGDENALQLLTDLEKYAVSDEAKRYAYAARAAIATAENKQKFYSAFTLNKEISESWIESAIAPFNSVRQADLTASFLQKALAELPNLKRNRKIFFVNGWLAAFIGGQRDERALATVNKFLSGNPNLDKDLRLKILEVADGLERAIKIRKQFGEKK